MSGVVVRTARQADLDRVGELTAAAYLADELVPHDDAYVEVLRDAAGRSVHATLLVAVLDGAVVGTVTLADQGSPFAEIARPGERELRMLAVDPGARGRGLGEVLLRAAIEQAIAGGADGVVLSTLTSMVAAHRVYDRVGLHRVPSRDWSAEGFSMLVYATRPA